MISTSNLTGNITSLFVDKPKRGKKMAAKKKSTKIPAAQKSPKGGNSTPISNAAQKSPGNRWDMKISK